MEQMKIQSGGDIHNSLNRADGTCRRYQRVEVESFAGDIADGNQVLSGIVENVSANGFKIRAVPAAFDGKKHAYKIVVYGDDDFYKLQATPCWEERGKDDVTLGFKIIDANWKWYEFVLRSFNNQLAS